MPTKDHPGPLDAKVAELTGILSQIREILPDAFSFGKNIDLQLLQLQRQVNDGIASLNSVVDAINEERKNGIFIHNP